MFMYAVPIKDVDRTLLKYIENIAEEYDCEVEETWQSKYNEYVSYNYEPFCADGFDLHITLKSVNPHNAEFVKHLYLKRKDLIDSLNKSLEAVKENKKK